MNNKCVGAILLIVGIAIGAGMLALPIVSSTNSLLVSSLLLFSSWTIMYIGALAMLEVNSWLPYGTNMITMAEKTLGRYGKLAILGVNLVALYTMISAYLSAAGDLLQNILITLGISTNQYIATILAFMILVSIVFRGIYSIDIVNRTLMLIKLSSLIAVSGIILLHVKPELLTQETPQFNKNLLLIMMTAFSFSNIMPSVRAYLKEDIIKVKKIMLWASLIPFILYLIWIIVVQGVLSRYGANGLISFANTSHPNSLLMTQLAQATQFDGLELLIKLFISICVLTSFLGVSLCLTDFIADGIKAKPILKDRIKVLTISYVPPLIIVLLIPKLFISALVYAGALFIILLVIAPLAMLYSGRYKKLLAKDSIQLLKGGKFTNVSFLICVTVLLCYLLV